MSMLTNTLGRYFACRFVVAAPGGAPLVRTHRAKLRPQATSDLSRDRRPQPQ